jgi:hypothetical protein
LSCKIAIHSITVLDLKTNVGNQFAGGSADFGILLGERREWKSYGLDAWRGVMSWPKEFFRNLDDREDGAFVFYKCSEPK